MRRIIPFLILLSGCGSGGSDTTVQTPPTNSSSQCDGDVSFTNPVPAAPVSDASSSDSSSGSSNSVPGIITPAVSKMLKMAKFQGLRVVGINKLADGTTIINTCGGTINIGGDTTNTNSNNTSGAAPQ